MYIAMCDMIKLTVANRCKCQSSDPRWFLIHTLHLWAPAPALLGPDGNGLGNRILDEMARRFERQHRRKTGASAIDPALDRAHGAITQRSRFTVRKSVGAYEKNCLPHLIRQPA